MSLKVPIKFANGTTIGPVTIVCSTVLFLGMFACFVLLMLYGDYTKLANVLRPLIPVLATVGSALLIWVKAHDVQTINLQQSETVNKVSDQVAATQSKLNGELDTRIASAVATALAQHDVTTIAATVTPPTDTPPTEGGNTNG